MSKKCVEIGKFDSAVQLLRMDLSTGAGKVFQNNCVIEDRLSFGFFEFEKSEPHLEFGALLATPEGPLLFFSWA
jgi:hypothetical protein